MDPQDLFTDVIHDCFTSNENRMIASVPMHDDVIKRKHFPRYWPFVWGKAPVTGGFPSQRLVTRSFDAFIDLSNNRGAGDKRHHGAHYDVTVMDTSMEDMCKIDRKFTTTTLRMFIGLLSAFLVTEGVSFQLPVVYSVLCEYICLLYSAISISRGIFFAIRKDGP